VRQLPKAAHIVGRFPISAKLYELPPSPTPKRRGAPRKKGALLGSPKTLAQTPQGWGPHPSEAGAEIQAWCGLWHAGLPGRLVRVVVLRRQGKPTTKQPGQRKPPPAIEAFVTTDLTLSADEIVREYGHRWAVEITHSIALRGRVVITHRKPPEVRICRLRNQSAVGTRPPSTSTPHCPACWARR